MSRPSSDPTFETAAAALRERFDIEHGDPGAELVADLAGCTLSKIADGVRTLTVGRTDEVFVLWPGESRLVRMPAGDVADELARLWRAGHDDLVLIDTAWRWVVLLDHEARLWAFEPD